MPPRIIIVYLYSKSCLQQEYAKLHDRYTELFKTHMDYMERTKLLLSTANERGEVRGRLGLNPVGRSSGKSLQY